MTGKSPSMHVLPTTACNYVVWLNTFPKKCLTTLGGEIVDPEIAVKLEMWDELKVHEAQT